MNAPESPPTSEGPKVTPDSPWLGLSPFTEDVRDYFFGRDREIQELHERVLHRPLTVLFGQSGLGKTSLLRAGLIPRLRESGYRPVLVRLVHESGAPTLDRQVLSEIVATFRASGWTPAREPADDTGLWQLFHDPDFGFTGTPAAEALRPVLIIDQFEDLFTLGAEKRPTDARAFLEALAGLVENRPPAAVRAALETDDALADRLRLSAQPCKVLLTLREDFLHALERWRRQMPSMMDNRFELRLLTGPQAYRAVHEPAEKRPPPAPSIVSPETARAIVRFVAGAQPDVPLEEIDNVPPLLSLICEQLNLRRIHQGQAAIESEALEQSAPEVLGEFYRAAFAQHPPAVRDFIERELISESGFRESVTLDTAVAELRRAGVHEPEKNLAALVDQRLLVIEDRGGVSRVEFTHDILAPIAAASRAEARQREAELLAIEGKARARQQLMRAWRLSGAFALVAFVAALAWFYGWKKQREAREQTIIAVREKAVAEMQKVIAVTEAQRAGEANQRSLTQLHRASMADLAAGMKAWREDFGAERKGERAAGFQGKSRWHEAVALLSRSLESKDTNATAAEWIHSTLLHRTLQKRDWAAMEFRQEDGVMCASFSPDGSKVVTASGDKTARVWDAASGKALGELLRHEDYVHSASFSPDGTKVVTASGNRTARVWDAASGEALGEPLRHEDYVYSASFSRDGTKVVTASGDMAARVWDAPSGKALGEAFRHEGVVNEARFSPDGTKVVPASGDETARVWEVPTTSQQQDISRITPEVLEWARAIAGLRFNDDGELQMIPDDERRATIASAQLPPGPWAELARWLNTPAPQRTLSPGSRHTLRAIAERERDFGGSGTVASLESALQYDPTVPLARLLLAEAREQANEQAEPDQRDASIPQQAAFLRRYDLDRLEAETGKLPKEEAAALWARAAAILRQRPSAKVGIGPKATLAGDEARAADERAAALK